MNEETLNKIKSWLDTKPMYHAAEYPNTCSIDDVEFIEFLETLVINQTTNINNK